MSERVNDRCKCGKPHDNWPGDGKAMLCRMCWESECDRAWWQAVIAIDRALHAAQIHPEDV